MMLLAGPVGSGKTYFYGEGVVFDADNIKELIQIVKQSRTSIYGTQRILVNAWFDIETLSLPDYPDVFIELHTNTIPKGHRIKVFSYPDNDTKVNFLLQHNYCSDAAKNLRTWWELKNYVATGQIPSYKLEEKDDMFWISKLGWRYAIWSGRREFQVIESMYQN